jgi:hypothetical protein
MDHYTTHSKSSNLSSFTPVNHINERSSTVTYGDGYVYTGPLNPTQYDIPTKNSTLNNDGQNLNSSSSASITNLSLSTSPSTEVVSSSTINQYQFKVMLLGDSGVGKLKNNCLKNNSERYLGKTCLLVRFKDGTFLAGSFIATVGIDFRNKLVTLGDKKIKLQIFDTVKKEKDLQICS